MSYLRFTLLSLGLSAVASASAFYSEDFQGAVGAEWSSSTTSAAPADSNRKVLGQFDNSVVTLSLSGLTASSSYTLNFDLYICESWDGSEGVGPDYFKLDIDGNTMLNETFDVVGNHQSYSASGSGFWTSGTDADEDGTLGYSFYGDNVYKFGGSINSGFTFVASGSTALIAFSGSGLQGVGDEGWGIDNVNVEAVPEPMSMAVLGLGALGLLKRRKKA